VSLAYQEISELKGEKRILVVPALSKPKVFRAHQEQLSRWLSSLVQRLQFWILQPYKTSLALGKIV